MDSIEISKIIGATLCALLLIFATKTLIDINMSSHGENAKVEGYTLEVEDDTADAGEDTEVAPATPEKTTAAADAEPAAQPAATPAEATSQAQPAKPAPTPAPPKAKAGFDAAAVVAQVASTNADAGKKVFKKCRGCHNAQAGKAATTGPNLWGIVDRPKASADGFKYSPAMSALGGSWTLEDLAMFLHKPKDFVPKTRMVFKGLKKDKDLVKLLAYLSSLK